MKGMALPLVAIKNRNIITNMNQIKEMIQLNGMSALYLLFKEYLISLLFFVLLFSSLQMICLTLDSL